MDSEYSITVITLTYRHFERLDNTILSVIAQEHPNFEYIISDDGSQDFPKDRIDAIMEAHSFTRYRVIHNEHNLGTVKNATSACKIAKGEIIVFLSCGDVFFDKDVLAKVTTRFNDRDCDVLAVRRLAYRGDYIPQCFLPPTLALHKLGKLQTPKQQHQAFISNSYYDALSGSALYYRKSTLVEMDYFDDKYALWEDGPFIEKYLRTSSIEFAFDIIGLWYEMGGVSTSKTVNPLLLKDNVLFDRNQRLTQREEHNRFYKSCIDYFSKRSYCNNLSEKVLLFLKFPAVGLFHEYCVFLTRVMKALDRIYLGIGKVNPPSYF